VEKILIRTELEEVNKIRKTLEWYQKDSPVLVPGLSRDLRVSVSKTLLEEYVRDVYDLSSSIGLSLNTVDITHLIHEFDPSLESLIYEIQIENFLETTARDSAEENPDAKPMETDSISSEDQQALLDYRSKYRRSLMGDQSLSAGDSLEQSMVRELRPGGGLPANKINQCLGMLIPRPTDPGEMIPYS
jgi:hypothetical protein